MSTVGATGCVTVALERGVGDADDGADAGDDGDATTPLDDVIR
jgi:hypothetical protein